MTWGLPGFPADTFWPLLGPIFSVLYTVLGGPHPPGMRKIRLIRRYNGAIAGLCAGILLGTLFRMGIGGAILSLLGAIPGSLAGTLVWRLPCTRRKPDAAELLHEETRPLTHYCPSFFEHFVRRYALVIFFAMVCVSAATWRFVGKAAPWRVLAVLGVNNGTNGLITFSRDGNRLFAVDMSSVRPTLPGDQSPASAIPPGGLFSPLPPRIQAWEIPTGDVTFSLDGDLSVSSLAFSANHEALIAVCGDWGKASIQSRNLSDGKLLSQQPGPLDGGHGASISLDGTTVAWLCKKGRIRIWDVAPTKEQFVFQGIPESYKSFLGISPNGHLLVVRMVVRNDAYNEDAIVLWDCRTGDRLVTLDSPPAFVLEITGIAFSADGSTLAAGNNNGMIKIWNTSTGHEAATFQHPSSQRIELLAFSPDGRSLLTTGPKFEVSRWARLLKGISRAGTLELTEWDIKTGNIRSSWRYDESRHPGKRIDADQIVFSPDGKVLAMHCSDGRVVLWEVAE